MVAACTSAYLWYTLHYNVHRFLKGELLNEFSMITNPEVVDMEYEKMARQIQSHYPNIEPFLLAKSAMLRKRYPNEKKGQHFWLELHYKKDIDPGQKGSKLLRETGIPAAYHGDSHFALDIQTDLSTVLAISSDPDIVRITGDVFPQ